MDAIYFCLHITHYHSTIMVVYGIRDTIHHWTQNKKFIIGHKTWRAGVAATAFVCVWLQ